MPRGSSRVPASRSRLQSLALVMLLLVVYGVLTPVVFRNADLPFDSDEAKHALNGLQLASDILAARWGMLLANLYLQEWYPPLLSVYLAPFFLAMGPAYWTARYPMVLALILNIALVYRVGKTLWRQAEIGLVAAVLISTSPVVWMHGLLCMEEMLAMTGALLVALAWQRSHQQVPDSHPGWGAWALGVSLAFTLMARTSSGLFAVGAVLAATHDLDMVAALTARGRRLKTVRIEGGALRSEPQPGED